MNNIDIIKHITNRFCGNLDDQEVLDKYFDSKFRYTSNGRSGNLKDYSSRLRSYMDVYRSIELPKWDELFASDDKVIVSYVLELETKDGINEKVAVLAVWRLKNGKIVSLREVEAKI